METQTSRHIDRPPTRIGVVLLCLPLLLLAGAPLLASESEQADDAGLPFSIIASAGFDYTSGDFGSVKETDSLYLPFSLKLDWEPFILKVTVPYLLIRGPDAVLGGGDDRVVTGGDSGDRDANSGLGDVVVSASYIHYSEREWLPILGFTGKVKIPTSDEDQGLSTGEFDYTLELDASKRFGRVTPFGSFGRRFVGDPDGFDLDGVFLASAGLGFRVSRSLSAGVAYDWRESSSRFSSDTHELAPYASWKLSDRLSLHPYTVIGLSQSAPDFGVGMQARVRFGR